MLHARPDYQRFQDPEGKIPVDEPVMLYRAQDKYFEAVCLHYAALLAADSEVDQRMTEMVVHHAKLGRDWRVHKTPDLPA